MKIHNAIKKKSKKNEIKIEYIFYFNAKHVCFRVNTNYICMYIFASWVNYQASYHVRLVIARVIRERERKRRKERERAN